MHITVYFLIALFFVSAYAQYIPDPNQCTQTLLTETAPDSFEELAGSMRAFAEGDTDGSGLQAASEVLNVVLRWAGHWEARCAGRYMSAADYDVETGWAVDFNADQYLIEAVSSKDVTITMKPVDGDCEETTLDMPRRGDGQRTFSFIEVDSRCAFDVTISTEAIHWELKFHRLTNTIPIMPELP